MSSPIRHPAFSVEPPRTPTSERPKEDQRTPQNRVSSAAAPAFSPSTLISPREYHLPEYVDKNLREDGQPNRELKRFSKSLEGKSYHSFVLDSAKKDPHRIRESRMMPDENGEIEVASSSNGSVRRWKFHESNAKGQRRLFPIGSEEGDKILKFEGSEAYELVQSYRKEDESTFEEYILKSRKRKRESESVRDDI